MFYSIVMIVDSIWTLSVCSDYKKLSLCIPKEKGKKDQCKDSMKA